MLVYIWKIVSLEQLGSGYMLFGERTGCMMAGD